MKKFVLLIALMLLCVPVMADDTSGAIWNGQAPAGLLDYYAGHNHAYEQADRDNPLGLGLDLIVYKSDDWYLNQVSVETRFDLANDEQAVFFVAELDLDKLRKGTLGS